MNANELKSERSAKLMATKLDKAYAANQGEEWAINAEMRAHGCSEKNFSDLQEIRTRRSAILDQMSDLRDAAKSRGWYVCSKQLRWRCAIMPMRM